MEFYLSPSDPTVRRLFKGLERVLAKPRIPIAERAAKVKAEQKIQPEDAAIFHRQSTFVIGSNQFLAYGGAGISGEVFGHFIADFGSLFEQAHFSVFVNREGNNQMISMLVSAVPRKKGDPFLPLTGLPQHPILALTLAITEDKIVLHRIKSHRKGGGGKALATLFNFAGETGKPKIIYSVFPCYNGARRFYYHIDFGRPIDKKWRKWEVDVPLAA
ncbi:MAG: hypothetical protein NT099_04400 [Candidatus Saganbacteria bacterium]|nr:hypothetical protein [Candidatus Saganbacteria bacterium]